MLFYFSISQQKVDSYWQKNANNIENKFLEFERNRVKDALTEIK